MKTWRIIALAASAVLLATSAALLTAAATGGTWETAANWLEAIATVAALGAAVAAALLVARTVQIELAREGERLEADRKAQAILVAAWPGTKLSRDWSPLREATSAAPRYRTIVAVSVHYQNASAVPIYDVTLDVAIRVRAPGGEWATGSGVADLGIVPPQTKEAVWVQLTEPLRDPQPEGERNPDDLDMQVTIYFRDAANHLWRRTPERLVEEP